MSLIQVVNGPGPRVMAIGWVGLTTVGYIHGPNLDHIHLFVDEIRNVNPNTTQD